MKRYKYRNTAWVPMFLAACLFLPVPGYPQVPGIVSYQGKVLNAGGQPLANGNHQMVFKFYDAATGGQLLLSDLHASVPFADGIYSIQLGSGTVTAGVETVFTDVFKNHSSVWMSTTIDADSEMAPRTQVSSAPYALNSDTVGGLSASQIVQASSPNQGKRFIGVSSTIVNGASGWKGLSMACATNFGTTFPDVVVCTSHDILATPVLAWPSLTAPVWVQPNVILSGIRPDGFSDYVDESGVARTNPGDFACNAWSLSSSTSTGLTIQTNGSFKAIACSNSAGVACCAP